MKVPTMRVKVKGTKTECLINCEDFDKSLHEEVRVVVEPEVSEKTPIVAAPSTEDKVTASTDDAKGRTKIEK